MFPFFLDRFYSGMPSLSSSQGKAPRPKRNSHEHQIYLYLIRISVTHQGCLGRVHWSTGGALRDEPSSFRGMILDLAMTWNTARSAAVISGIIWITSTAVNSYLGVSKVRLLASDLRFCSTIIENPNRHFWPPPHQPGTQLNTVV